MNRHHAQVNAAQYKEQADGFLAQEVHARGLDPRTEKAYGQDLKLFGTWLEANGMTADAESMQAYLTYLIEEKNLMRATVMRKYRVLRQFLAYLYRKGVSESEALEMPEKKQPETAKTAETARTEKTAIADEHAKCSAGLSDAYGNREEIVLTRAETDALFSAFRQNYNELESDFRRRVCQRDSAMMELLFYHMIEISELVALKTSDYDRASGVLTIRGKRGKIRSVRIYAHSLRSNLEHYLDAHGYFERNPAYADYLFLSKIGKPLSMWMVIKIFSKYKELAGIAKPVTPKDLKQSMRRYAQELLEEKSACAG